MSTTWFKESKYAWIGLGLLWIIGFISALTRFSMAYFQVQISEGLQISRSFISMAYSTNLLIGVLCTPLGGFLVDRYGPKKVMLLSSSMGILGTGIVLTSQNPISFFIGYGIISGFVGVGLTTTYVLMFEWFKHHRAKALSLLASSNSVGLAVVTPIFVTASWLTWRDAFLAAFVLGVFVTLPIIWLGIKGLKQNIVKKVEEDGEVNDDNPKNLHTETLPPKGAVSHLPIFIFVGIALFTCGINMGSVEMNLVAIHQLENVSPTTIALSMTILGMLEITGSLMFGYFLDRFNKLIIMTILYGIRIIGFTFLFMHLGSSPIFFAIAFGITYLSAVPGGILVVNEFAKGRGKQTGFLLIFHQSGGMIGPLIGGLSFDYFKSYQQLIAVNLVMCAIVTLGYFIIFNAHRRSIQIQNTKVVVSEGL